MDPARLSEYLDVLRAQGVTKAHLAFGDVVLDVQLSASEPEQIAATPFVDKGGRPVELDEEAPWNARDPIEAANFPGKSGS